MCKLSWQRSVDGLELYLDRERSPAACSEPRTEPAGEPLLLVADEQLGYESPLLGVNEAGAVTCLLGPSLGGGQQEIEDSGNRDAMALLRVLAPLRTEQDLRRELHTLDLVGTPPVRLLRLAREGDRLWHWNGVGLREELAPRSPLYHSERNTGRMRRPGLSRFLKGFRLSGRGASRAGERIRLQVDFRQATVAVEQVLPAKPAGESIRAERKRMPIQPADIPEGVEPPERVPERCVDPRAILREKAPALERRLPAPVKAMLPPLVRAKSINRGLRELHKTPCREFPDQVLQRLGLQVSVHGCLPAPEQRPVLVANHPQGGIDGLIMIALMLRYYPQGRVPVNDVLLCLPHLRPFFLPVDRFGGARQGLRQLAQAFAGDAAILMFPAGRTARMRGGKLEEFPWQPTAVRLARRHGRPLVPAHVDTRNSASFYALHRLRQMLGVGLNLEMLCLPGEFLKPARRKVAVQIGAPIRPETLEGADDAQRAAHLRRLCMAQGEAGMRLQQEGET